MPRASTSREAFWRELLARHVSSNHSVDETCRKAGVSTASFYAWRRRLGASSPSVERSALVPVRIVSDVVAGALFLFVHRRRNSVKVLFFTGDGLAIFYRRLERGTFELPKAVADCPDSSGVEVTASELSLILEGIELTSVKRRKRWRPAI